MTMDRRLELCLPWLGKMTDSEVCERLSMQHGLCATEYTVGKWRKERGIPAGPRRPHITDEERRSWVAAYRRLGSVWRVANRYHAEDSRVRLALRQAGVLPWDDEGSTPAGHDTAGTG